MATGPVFDAYVMVDWSAESKRKTGADSIWYCCVERGRGAIIANPPTRDEAATALADLLNDLASRGRVTLAGFDFAFGYPAGFAAGLGGEGNWRTVWKALSARLKDGADNVNNRFAAAAEINRAVSGKDFPFWGCPPGAVSPDLSTHRPNGYGDGSLAEKRLTELRLIGPQPVWKLFYNGSVGGQSLLGIPRAFALRHHPWLDAVTRVWPFETGLKPLEKGDWTVLMAEIYPSLIRPDVARGEVRDAVQVKALAEHFRGLDDSGRLAALFAGDPALTPGEKAVVEREEGWILGAAAKRLDTAYLKDPQAIYAESFAAIRRETDLTSVPPDLEDVVVRIVHACGMTDIVDELFWTPGAGEAGRRALAAGAPILVDAEMVAHGITRSKLAHGNRVICTLGEAETAALAKRKGTTRSAAAVEMWRPYLKDAVVAIGNAPTALFRLLEMIEQGAPRPAVVLGFPVGFVGAAESKEALLVAGVPCLTLRGRRGGSAMAAAAVNALAGGLES